MTFDSEFLLQFFSYAHLPEHLQTISRPLGDLASKLMELPRNSERSAALRKLIEAKDCAVRAKLAIDLDPVGLQEDRGEPVEPRPEE